MEDEPRLRQLSCVQTRDAAGALDVEGNHAYIASRGFHIIDVTDPSNPIWVSTYALNTFFSDVQVTRDLAYLVQNTGITRLHIVDVSDPAKPVRIGGYAPPGEALNLWLEGETLCVADGSRGLQILGERKDLFRLTLSTTLGQPRLTLSGASGTPAVLEISTNLMNWSPIWTNTAGTGEYADPQGVPQNPKRFYRARQ